MAYATKYYDYQIAIIFAILLGGLLLLALVVGAIYFICVVNMRGKKSGIMRAPSGRSTARTRLDWPQPAQQPYISAQPQQYQPQYGLPETTSYPQQYPAAPSQQQYNQNTMGVRVRELQPDYFQQQGPITYTSVHPYEHQEQQHQQQSNNFQQIPITSSYHMSSV